MATQTVGSVDLTNKLVEAAQLFSEDIYRRTVDTSVWLKLIEQTEWPDGMGDTISVLTYERTLPTTQNSWSNINSDSTKFAIPDATNVDIAQTIRTYGLQHTAIESQNLVLNDVRFGFKFQEQLRAVYDNLVENVQALWQKRYRDEYRRLCGNKVVATQNASGLLYKTTGADYPKDIDPGTVSSGIFPNIATLTQSLLDVIRLELMREGAGNKPMGRENGVPVFSLVCGPEISRDLILMNPAIREDFRYSSNVSELLKPLGVERSYGGWYHTIDIQIPRYNYVPAAPTIDTFKVTAWDSASKTGTVTLVGTAALDNLVSGQKFTLTSGDTAATGTVTRGTIITKSAATGAGTFTFMADAATAGSGSAGADTWTTLDRDFSTTMTQGFTEVPFYVPDGSHTPGPFISNQGGSSAKRWIVNPNYETAQYEEAFVMHPDVMKSMIPRPLTSPGGNVNFDARSYRGDFKFLNIPDRVINPDGNHGYFRGVLASGSKPCRPEWGYAIIFQRAPIAGVYQRPSSTLVAASSALVPTYGAAIAADGQD